MYHYLLSLSRDESLAEELTAETFYQAYLHIGQFRGECRIETWLCRIARNAYFKEQKKRKRHVPLESLGEAADGESLADRLSDKEKVLRVIKSLHVLKEPYKEVFSLRILGELSFREIAEVFGRTESWAKVTFYRAKEKIIRRMENEYED